MEKRKIPHGQMNNGPWGKNILSVGKTSFVHGEKIVCPWEKHSSSGCRRWKEPSVPGSVSIAEALELTERYSDPEDKKFVNGVLGTILRELEAAQ